MSRVIAISCITLLGLLVAACAGAQPNAIETIPPRSAVVHAKGGQIDVAKQRGAPDAVRIYVISGVSRWVYCTDDGARAHVIDFDYDGNILVSLELLEDYEDSVCEKRRPSYDELGPHAE